VSETTLRQLVKEAMASERIYHQKVRKVIRGSYSNHYRRMVPRLLQTLRFAAQTAPGWSPPAPPAIFHGASKSAKDG
jgi:hypothetical protein